MVQAIKHGCKTEDASDLKGSSRCVLCRSYLMLACYCRDGASRQPAQLLSSLTAKSWLKRCAKELIKSRTSLKIWSMLSLYSGLLVVATQI